MSVTQVSNLLYFDKENLEAARRALQIPALSHGWKGSFEDRLAKAERSHGVESHTPVVICPVMSPKQRSVFWVGNSPTKG